MHDGLVDVGIEVGADARRSADAALLQEVVQLRVDQLDALAIALGLGTGIRRSARDRNRRRRRGDLPADRRRPGRPARAARARRACGSCRTPRSFGATGPVTRLARAAAPRADRQRLRRRLRGALLSDGSSASGGASTGSLEALSAIRCSSWDRAGRATTACAAPSTTSIARGYLMRVGPMTPIVPVASPSPYVDAMRLKDRRCGSGCSAPMTTVSPGRRCTRSRDGPAAVFPR